MFEDYTIESLFVCTSRRFEDARSLHELFKQVDDIEKPDSIANYLADIDSDEPEESSIVFSKGDPEEYRPRKPDSNAAIIDVGAFEDDPDQDLLHFHMDISSSELIDDFNRLFINIIDLFESLQLRGFGVDFSTENQLSDYELPVKRQPEFEIHGVRFSGDDYHYLFQDLREFGEDDKLIFQLYTGKDFTIDSTTVGSLIETEIESGIEFVRGCEK